MPIAESVADVGRWPCTDAVVELETKTELIINPANEARPGVLSVGATKMMVVEAKQTTVVGPMR